MRRKILVCAILIIVVLNILAVVNYYKYRQFIGDLKIVHYISCCGGNLDYLIIYLNVVLPEEKYHGNFTMNLIRLYVIIRNEKIPNYIQITLYDSMENLGEGNSYAEKTFSK